MDPEEHQQRAASFGRAARNYESARPDYPAESVSWLVGDEPRRVLDLGAGTGKLTRMLAGASHDVVAVDPSVGMLDALGAALPEVEALVGSAESIPVPDDSVDVVTVAQAFHWFDHARALPEIARVLRPGGRLSLVWNLVDVSVPWVVELWRAISPDEPADVTTPAFGGHFLTPESATFGHAQRLDRTILATLIGTRSYVAVRPPAERAALIAKAQGVFDRHAGPQAGSLALPYLTRCYRVRVGPSAS